MARRTAEITIDADGRDKGKMFLLTEMSAAQTEEWATRALLAMVKSGVQLPDDIAQQGVIGIARLGIKAFLGLNFADAKPLLAELMTCVQTMPEPAHSGAHRITRRLVDEDIEEVLTRLRLKQEVFDLHTGFSTAAFLSRLGGAASNPTANEPTPSTKTSRPQSPRSSPRALRR